MAKITKISAQKRAGRYNVFLDGKYAFPVAESVLVEYQLSKGLEIDDALQKRLENADQVAKAYSRMLDFLSHQLRTEHEVRAKLKEIGADEVFIEPVIARLKKEQLINDATYAGAYVRTVMRTALKGPGNIRQHLRQKRVPEVDIDQALTQFDSQTQLTNAGKLAKKLFRRYRRQPMRRREQKVRQGLMAKGYSSEVFDAVKQQVEPTPDSDHESELLQDEFTKVWRRNRRYQGRERIMRTKRAMYSKGFNLDDVQRLIDQQVG